MSEQNANGSVISLYLRHVKSNAKKKRGKKKKKKKKEQPQQQTGFPTYPI